MSDYIAVSSYEVLKRLNIPIYYFYMLIMLEFLSVLYVLFHEIPFAEDMKNEIQ